MTGMLKVTFALALLLAACSSTSAATSSTTTVPAQPSTTRAPTPSTTVALPVEVQDCSAPSVPFSPLCEAYDLIQEWHVDRPFDPESLAEAAIAGVDGFETELTEPPPRALICAVPDAAFTPMCDHIGARVAADSVPLAPVMGAAVTSMMDLALDPFSYYVPPDQVGSFRSNGVVGGIGVLLDATDAAGSRCVRVTAACPLRIVFVVEDNPAAEAGLAAGDVITAIDGEAVDGLGFVDAAGLLAGDETGEVEVTIDRAGSSQDISMTRAALQVPTVEVDIPRSRIGWIRIPDFEEDIADLVRDGLEELIDGGIDTLVVDLRDNPGGYVDTSILVMSEFIDDGVLAETTAPDGDAPLMSLGDGIATGLEVIVVVNEGTASAAEITAAALRDRIGAVIVGQPTFGKDAVQIPFELRNGGELYVAVARWTSPSGDSVSDGGLIPDHPLTLSASLTPDQVVDQALEAAR
jgi:carboxyl-terminal processing protease